MKFIRLFVVLAVGASLLMTAPLVAAKTPPRELVTGLSSPKGLDAGDGTLVIGQGAFGPPGPVLVYETRGRFRGTSSEVTPPLNLMDVAVSPADGSGWGIGGDLVLYHQPVPGGAIVPVLDFALYQSGDLDPVDQEDNPSETNPYGLTVLPNGDALVADAAGNDLVRVTPSGDAWTVARFDVQATATDHLGPGPFPPTIDAEAVPTTVTLGPGGDVLVGQLTGFPFRPGTANIWRIDPDAVGAWCSVSGSSGGCSIYRQGFSGIQDIDYDGGTGWLAVLELAEDGVLAFEAGFETGDFPPAVLTVFKGNSRHELATGQLSQPGGVALDGGKIYVSDRIFTPFGGRVVRVTN